MRQRVFFNLESKPWCHIKILAKAICVFVLSALQELLTLTAFKTSFDRYSKSQMSHNLVEYYLLGYNAM
jgi:hypothetical protein